MGFDFLKLFVNIEKEKGGKCKLNLKWYKIKCIFSFNDN